MRVFLFLICIVFLSELGIRVCEAIVYNGRVDSLTNYIQWGPNKSYWTLTPNAEVIQSERVGDILYRSNSLGYRGEEVASTPASGLSILFLGDSLTFGQGVQEEYRFSDLLSNDLSRFEPEIINLSNSGYSPYDYLSTWRRIGSQLKPDIVVLLIYINDFGVEPSNKAIELDIGTRLRLSYRLLREHSALLRRAHQALHMAYFYSVRRWIPRSSVNPAEPRAISALIQARGYDDEVGGVIPIKQLLNEIKATGSKSLVVYSPHEAQMFTKEYDVINQLTRKVVEPLSDRYIDLTQAFRQDKRQARLWNDGLHPSKYGHRVVADILSPEIEDLIVHIQGDLEASVLIQRR